MKLTIGTSSRLAGVLALIGAFGCSGEDGGGRTAAGGGGGPRPSSGAGGTDDQGAITGLNVGPSTGGVCGGEDANILFVVDRSGSMNCNLPSITESRACEQNPVQADPGQPRKWDIIRGSLKSSFQSLIPDPGGIAIRAGLAYFSADSVCGVVSAPAVQIANVNAGHIGVMSTSLDNEQPKGGTPIVGATILAYKHLHQQLQANGTGNVVILTDGADSCGSSYEATLGRQGNFIEELIKVEMPKAVEANIRTFVIGAPGSENARRMLSQMAEAGGTARDGCTEILGKNVMPVPGASEGDCHFDMTLGNFEEKLGEALAEITKIVACRVE